MKIISLFTAMALLAVFFSGNCFAADDIASVNTVSGISAQAYALIDADSGELIYGKNERIRLGMASTTKIMTAIVAIESCDVETVVSISEKAVGIEGSSIYLRKNEELSLKELLYALLLESANDAACAIAIAVSGCVDEFVSQMNEKACDIGLTDTHYANPHGLADPTHYTTAYDLSLLMAYCMRNTVFASITGTKKMALPGSDSSYSRLLVNHNRLLSEKGISGGKTGFTKKTGRCLVTFGEQNGVRLCASTLNAPSDWNDHRQLYSMGYTLYKSNVLEPGGVIGESAYVCGGNASEVKLCLNNSISATLREGVELSRIVNLRRFYYAPICEGDILGSICYYNGDVLVCKENIIAVSSVNKKEYKKSFFEKVFRL